MRCQHLRYSALSILALVLQLACNDDGVGETCEQTADCSDGLICDVHDGAGTCQDADHSHGGSEAEDGGADTHAHETDDHDHLVATSDGGHDHHSTMQDGGVSHHHEAVDVSDWPELPKVTLQATADPMSGWNLNIETSNFRLAPERASTDVEPGEGHMHLYVDGEKQTRLYGLWHHLPALAQGQHTVRIELSANDHSPLSSDGTLIDAEIEIEQADGGEHNHTEKDPLELEEAGAEVELVVHDDPAAGYNLELRLKEFSLSPENASTEHVEGEGHAHLFVDGTKIGRVYTEWLHLAPLDPGEHEIRVSLNSNDHRELTVSGDAVEDTAELTVE